MTSKEAFLAAFVSKNNLFSEISETFGKVPKFPKDFSESFGNVGEGGARNHVSRL